MSVTTERAAAKAAAAQLLASKPKGKTVISGLEHIEDMIFGNGLWKEVVDAQGNPYFRCVTTCENDLDTPLEFQPDISGFPAPSGHYAQSSFMDSNGEPQIYILVKTSDTGGRFYATILRDKDGEIILSDTDTYTCKEVECARKITFAKDAKGGLTLVPNRDDVNKTDEKYVVINQGHRTIKAYAA